MSNDNRNNEGKFEQLSGGVVRYTTNSAPAQPAVPTPVDGDMGHGVQDGGTFRIQGNGQVTREGGVVSFNSSDLAPKGPGTTIMMTARSAMGSLVSGDALLKDGVTVELEPGNPASRTTLKVAKAMGVIFQDGDGRYLDNSAGVAAADKAKAEAEQKAAQSSQELFGGGFEEELNTALAPVDQGLHDSTVIHAIMHEGELDPQRVTAIAEQMKVSTTQVVALAERVIAAYTQHIQTAVAAVGITAQHYPAFSEWLQTQPEELHDARFKLMMTRSTAGFRALAEKFNRDVPPSEAELNANVYETFTKNGHLMVNVGGQIGIMSAAALAKSGLLKRK